MFKFIKDYMEKGKLKKDYRAYAYKFIKIDPYSLNFNNFPVSLRKCTGCQRVMHISEEGLTESNVCLYLKIIKEKDININSYCVGKGIREATPCKKGFTFCYEEEAIPYIEKAIKLSEEFVSIINSIISVRKRIDNLKKYKNIKQRYFVVEVEKEINKRIKERRRMWLEIEEGIKRVLLLPKNKEFRLGSSLGKLREAGGKKILMCHGHELRELIDSNIYFGYNIDAFIFGHYHRLIIMKRYNCWIIISGCFVRDPTPRLPGFLSHCGCTVYKVDTEGKEVFFNLFRL